MEISRDISVRFGDSFTLAGARGREVWPDAGQVLRDSAYNCPLRWISA